MRLLAPAKINLHLRVGPPRPDGFHPLLSWFVTVGLFDTLTLEAVEGRGGKSRAAPQDRLARAQDGAVQGTAGNGTQEPVEVTLQCDLPGLPCDERNLVVRIARAWGNTAREANDVSRAPVEGQDTGVRARGSWRVGGIRATLLKRIPVGAGLGGGSSDAARTLLGLNRLWETNRAAGELSEFAARFGSDLPFFFHGPSSVCRGRGEIVRPVPRPSARWAVLMLPDLAMPTAQVYRRFDEMKLGRERDLLDEPDWSTWSALGSEELLPRLVNDLEAPAFSIAPRLGAMRADAEQALGRPVRMSGSGSSLFTLFDEESQAHAAAEALRQRGERRVEVVEVAPDFEDDLNATSGVQ